MPPTYLCQRCTACCRWPGFVRVTEEEIRSIAHHLGMEEGRFIQDYTRLRPNRGGLALIDREDGACFFLKGNECSIQSVKPQQCKDFPNSWNFPGWRDVCEAIEVPERGSA
ncbi:MAG: YkgJ family cysteine cluster protein [Chthoniobacterales bacterium]